MRRRVQGSGFRVQESGSRGPGFGINAQDRTTLLASASAGVVAYSIEISNRQRLLRVNRVDLRRVAYHVLGAEGIAQAAVGIALVDDAAIRSLHWRFLGLDSPTDVLTFPLSEPDEPLSGEIVISVETAVREGPRHQLRPEDELLLYLTHGILHLCGYGDRTARGARTMRRRQNELLRQLGSAT